MPKKMGVNSKAEAARERRSAAEADRRDRQERAKEEQHWAEAEGPKSRAARRREEDAEKRAEAAARKAENRRLAEAEAAAAAAASASAPSKAAARKASRVAAPPPKVTEAELARRREEERLRLEREAEAAKKRAARVAEEEEYERVVLVANTNRDDSIIEARSVEEAIARMSVVDPQAALPADKHPERRLKSSFKVHQNSSFPPFTLNCLQLYEALQITEKIEIMPYEVCLEKIKLLSNSTIELPLGCKVVCLVHLTREAVQLWKLKLP